MILSSFLIKSSSILIIVSNQKPYNTYQKTLFNLSMMILYQKKITLRFNFHLILLIYISSGIKDKTDLFSASEKCFDKYAISIVLFIKTYSPLLSLNNLTSTLACKTTNAILRLFLSNLSQKFIFKGWIIIPSQSY